MNRVFLRSSFYFMIPFQGKDSDGSTGGSVLDTVITGIDQRTPLCIGSANEVDRFNAMVLGK